MEITDFKTFSKAYFTLSVCVTANLQRKNTPNFDVFPPAHAQNVRQSNHGETAHFLGLELLSIQSKES